MTDPIQIPGATRVEVIDTTGRAFVAYYEPGVEIHVQDDARTVKVFAGDRATHGGASRPAPTEPSDECWEKHGCDGTACDFMHPGTDAPAAEPSEWFPEGEEPIVPRPEPIEAGEREVWESLTEQEQAACEWAVEWLGDPDESAVDYVETARSLIAAGFRRAPIEVTDEMVAAGMDAYAKASSIHDAIAAALAEMEKR